MTNYEVEYVSMLEAAFRFLYRKQKKIRGSALNPAHQKFIQSFGGQCLHCGCSLTQKNSNTEHIHDLALGGDNSINNKVIMCISCNDARNITMQEYLGTPSYWRGFPGNWDRVKNYLLWNAVTVDKGHNCGKEFPEVHQIFESNLNQKSVSISPPNSWFGRGNQSNLIFAQNFQKRGLFVRFFDKIFGYSANQTKGTFPPIVLQDSSNEAQRVIQTVTSKNKRSYPDVDDDFQKHILSALREISEEVKVETFCNYFTNYLENKGLPPQSLKLFANSFGIPKRRNIVEILDYYFPQTVDYRFASATELYISLKESEEE